VKGIHYPEAELERRHVEQRRPAPEDLEALRQARYPTGELAAQLGHGSNFWGSVDPLIEPADVYCFSVRFERTADACPGCAPTLDTSRTRQGAQVNSRMAGFVRENQSGQRRTYFAAGLHLGSAISTLRFLIRPSSELLSATGWVLP